MRPVESYEALREAFEQHYPWLVRLCGLLSGRPDMAEDLAQECFVRSARRIGQLPRGEWSPYLRTVAVNLWRSHLKRMKLERRSRQRMETWITDSGSAIGEREDLWRGLRSLGHGQRACIVLRYYLDMSERDVAGTLGCSVGTVKSQTSKGLSRLRRVMGDDYRS